MCKHLSEIQDCDFLTDSSHKLHIVLDQEDRHIKFPVDKPDSIHKLCGLVRVHAGGRLVQQQKLWTGCQCTRDFKLSLLAVGQVAGKNISLFFQAENIEKFLGFIAHTRFVFIMNRQTEHALRRRATKFRAIMQPDHNVADNRHVIEQTNVLERARDTLMVDGFLGLAGEFLAV